MRYEVRYHHRTENDNARGPRLVPAPAKRSLRQTATWRKSRVSSVLALPRQPRRRPPQNKDMVSPATHLDLEPSDITYAPDLESLYLGIERISRHWEHNSFYSSFGSGSPFHPSIQSTFTSGTMPATTADVPAVSLSCELPPPFPLMDIVD